MIKIKRAILSVSDKSGIAELASALHKMGIDIISSGGTKKVLDEQDIPSRQVSTITQFPEILNGRVKTLHPAVFGGLLATEKTEHQNQLKELSIVPIDLVVVNLYPFEETIAREGITLEEALDQIDIGGPAMIRAAAKNYIVKTVITSPSQYDMLLEEMDRNKGAVSDSFRHNCAVRAFQHVARYNTVIADYLNRQNQDSTVFPDDYVIQGRKIQNLRYGENPHQHAAFYAHTSRNPLHDFKQLHGKELSYNNILDLHAAISMVSDFKDNFFTVIIKHNNPSGAGRADSITESYQRALSGDPVSAFGGIAGMNREVTPDVAEEMSKHFFECIIAPSFTDGATKILTKKKNLRLLTYNPVQDNGTNNQFRSVEGGFLIQSPDDLLIDIRKSKNVTKREPSNEEWTALEFAWRMTKHVHSNAIVLGYPDQLIGIGAGQMSRVDSAELAIKKASQAGHKVRGSVAGSDAFFPFRDGVDALAEAGVSAVIQPGGSVRDDEVITAANEHGMAMIFAGFRHFKH